MHEDCVLTIGILVALLLVVLVLAGLGLMILSYQLEEEKRKHE